MFCEKCGAQLPDKAVFCEKCGTPVGGQAAGTGTGTPFYPPMPPKKPSALKKFFSVKRNVILTAAAAAALLILITVIAVISAMPKKVYVDKYFDIVYTGCDGYATPSVKWNDDALKKIDKKIFSRKVKPREDFGLGDLWNSFQENLSLKDCVSVSLDRENAYLKNGDKITVSVKPGFTDFEKLYKIKLAIRHSTVKVSGLKEAVEFNPFEGVSVVFDGYTGFGKATVNVPSSPVMLGDSRLTAEFTSAADGYSIKIYDSTGENPSTYHLRCTFDRVLSLSNGDVITCTVQDADRLVSVMGVSLSAAEKKVTVGGLSDMLSYDPSNEVSAVFSGFSGYGEAEIKLPGDKTLGSYIIRTEADVSASRLRLYTVLCDANGNELRRLRYDADKTKYFANSDTVTFSLNTSGNTLEADYGITLAETFTVTVSGLEEPVDPKFADRLSVAFEGFEGYGKIGSLALIGEDVYTVGKYTFKLTPTLEPGSIFGKCLLSVVVADESGNLFTVEYRTGSFSDLGANGEEVKFTCRTGSSGREKIARQYGIALPESLDYTVSGLKATTAVDPREMLTYAFSGENGKIVLDFGLKQAEMTAGGCTIALKVESGESWGSHETTLTFTVTAEDGTEYTGKYYATSGSLSEGDTVSVYQNINVSKIAEATGLVFSNESVQVIVSTK